MSNRECFPVCGSGWIQKLASEMLEMCVVVAAAAAAAAAFADHTPFIFLTFHFLVASRPAAPCNNSRAALNLACETLITAHVGSKESI